MRLWSLHPKYLDTKGLLAAWREGLLAKKVLEDNIKGYRNHPQLQRFKAAPDPIRAINAYLCYIVEEARSRSFAFDEGKITPYTLDTPLTVTDGQLAYEWQHLLRKLETRDPERYQRIVQEGPVVPHPLFRVVKGNIAEWEVLA